MSKLNQARTPCRANEFARIAMLLAWLIFPTTLVSEPLSLTDPLTPEQLSSQVHDYLSELSSAGLGPGQR